MFEKTVNFKDSTTISFIQMIKIIFSNFFDAPAVTVSSTDLTGKDRVRQSYPRIAYKLRETIFEKLDGLNIPYIEDSNRAIFDFESICVPTEELNANETTTWLENTSLFLSQYVQICQTIYFWKKLLMIESKNFG